MYAMNKKDEKNVISMVKLLIQVEAVKRKSKRGKDIKAIKKIGGGASDLKSRICYAVFKSNLLIRKWTYRIPYQR